MASASAIRFQALPVASAPASGALAADADGSHSAPALPTPAAQLVASHLREPAARSTEEALGQPRPGMFVVLRLAGVDMVAHPASGDVDIAPGWRLLHRSIARAPLAVGVAWRF